MKSSAQVALKLTLKNIEIALEKPEELFMEGGFRNEKNLSAKEKTKTEGSRLSQKNVNF